MQIVKDQDQLRPRWQLFEYVYRCNKQKPQGLYNVYAVVKN